MKDIMRGTMKDIGAEGLAAEFADCWARGLTFVELQKRFGMSGAAINQLRAALGLPPRRPASAKPKADVARAAREIRVPAMAPHPFWTPERDLAVMVTRGAYREVEVLAVRLGKSKEAVMQRWHKLRAA